eukprot:565622-Rhodomonas_salina.1
MEGAELTGSVRGQGKRGQQRRPLGRGFGPREWLGVRARVGGVGRLLGPERRLRQLVLGTHTIGCLKG